MAPSRPFTGRAPEAPRGGTHILQGVVADRVKELGLIVEPVAVGEYECEVVVCECEIDVCEYEIVVCECEIVVCECEIVVLHL